MDTLDKKVLCGLCFIIQATALIFRLLAFCGLPSALHCHLFPVKLQIKHQNLSSPAELNCFANYLFPALQSHYKLGSQITIPLLSGCVTTNIATSSDLLRKAKLKNHKFMKLPISAFVTLKNKFEVDIKDQSKPA